MLDYEVQRRLDSRSILLGLALCLECSECVVMNERSFH